MKNTAVFMFLFMLLAHEEALAMKPGDPVPALWRSLARKRVLVRILDLGAERSNGTLTGRMGWRLAFEALGRVASARPEALDGIHEVRIERGQHPGVDVREEEGTTSLGLIFAGGPEPKGARRQAGPGIASPTAPQDAAILKAVAGLKPRRKIDVYEFDNRFALFLAGHGLGLSVADVATRDATGAPAFHAVLRAYGDSGAGRDRLARALARVDRNVIPQLMLRKGAIAEALLEEPVEASFPAEAARKVRPVVTYQLKVGRPLFPDLSTADW